MFGKRQRSSPLQFNIPEIKDCYAKTFDRDGKKQLGRKVVDHCIIVGQVARELVRQLPEWLQSALFPSGVELVAAAHDVGKICPTFQKKIYDGASVLSTHLPGVDRANPEEEDNWGWHQGVSKITAKACGLRDPIAKILGMHHGREPCTRHYSSRSESLGGEPWQECREKCLVVLREALFCDWPAISLVQQPIIAGLTTVADWIGSGAIFDDPKQLPDIKMAIELAGFKKPILRAGLTFFEIFEFEPLPAQEALIQACQKPGVYILEAPMGYGKTEAALYSAYQMLLQDKAIGIYFALPTQLTSNAMYERMEHFLHKICEGQESSRLLHSNSWLHDMDMGSDAAPGKSWFNGNKRGILAPFAVGTIDQALLSVIHVCHGFVRAFGLAGKVVVIDEAHCYDLYTGTLLDELVEMLVQWHCTVIILSATLTKERRGQLMRAQSNSEAYPLVSAINGDVLCEIASPPSNSVEVKIHKLSHDTQALEEALKRASQGQQVLWIENSVAESQDIYRQLASRGQEIGVQCGLLHSRFLKRDRKQIEDTWVSILEKGGSSSRKKSGRILVGTQVLEQSLDIDVDFLVSRICPTDMLLQRLGRLWRHSKTIRPSEAIREAWVLVPSQPSDFGISGIIYSPYILHRTLEVWSHLCSVILPDQIRSLIEATYADREEQSVLLIEEKRRLQEKRNILRLMASRSFSTSTTALSDEDTSTRYSEVDTVEILLLRSWQKHGKGVSVVLLDGEQVELSSGLGSERKSIAAKLKLNTLMVSVDQAPRGLPSQSLNWIKDYLYIGEGRSILRVGIVMKSGEIRGIDGARESSSYDPNLGYCFKKG